MGAAVYTGAAETRSVDIDSPFARGMNMVHSARLLARSVNRRREFALP